MINAAAGAGSACPAGPARGNRAPADRSIRSSSTGSRSFRPRPGCLRNLLSSIGQTRAFIRSLEPLIRYGSSTRSTITTMPSNRNDRSTDCNFSRSW